MRIAHRTSTAIARRLDACLRRHRAGAAFLLVAAAVALGTSGTIAQEKAAVHAAAEPDLSLFADPVAIANANEIQCGIRNNGLNCVKIFNTVLGGGGFWPSGSPNQYIFATGFQIAGIVGADGGPWAGDTTGAYFFDSRGTQPAATPLTGVFDSRDPEDRATWPSDARIDDEDLFRPSDIGRIAISDQDTWVQYWEGDPSRISGREHPAGISVKQRSLQRTYPSGVESVIYFLVELTNVTHEDEFQRLNEAAFFGGEERLPEQGYTLENLYFNVSADMDVTSNAGQNFSTAFLPFEMVASYHGAFTAPAFAYPPQIFYPPFHVDAPGMVGIKYLRTPADPATGQPNGLTLWTTYGGSSVGFPEPFGSEQLLRYMTGEIDPRQGDFPCNVTPEIATGSIETTRRSVCTIHQTARDTRFMMATGPFELAPGESETLAVAYVVGPVLDTLPDGTSTGIEVNAANDGANPPGIPSWHPGFSSARGCADATATNCTTVDPVNPVKPLERAAGWVAYSGTPPQSALESPAHRLDQYSVETAPHSLLDRALVAQTVFDAKFLRPMPPEPPVFHLLPGPNEVTVVFEPSATNEIGDPYFELASDPTSPLYNPNYRQFDVQGYEIWRGTSADDLELVARFLDSDPPFVDTTCELVRPHEDIGNSAGSGYAIGETCPDDYERTATFVRFFNNGVPGGRPGRGVVRASTGGAALVDSLGVFPLPEWDGVRGFDARQFLYRDTTVVNNFTYFYAVAAFDLNSPASGPAVQRSELIAKSVLPRRGAPNLANAELVFGLTGDDGELLETPRFSRADVDRETGVFSRPFPPTDAFEQSFARFVPQLMPAFSLEVRIDSVVVRHTGNTSDSQEFEPTATGFCEGGASPGDGRVASPFGACWEMYLGVTADGVASEVAATGYNPWWGAFGEPGVFTFTLMEREIDFDRAALDAFGVESGSAIARVEMTSGAAIANNAAEGPQNRRFGEYHGGARWFDGNSAEGARNPIADPARFRRVGHLTGIDTIFAPIAYTPSDASDFGPWNNGAVQFEKQCFSRAVAFLDRAADIVFTWQSAGRVSVRDVTHRVNVAFSPRAGPTWGFLTTDANGNGVIDWHDFNYIDGALPVVRQVDGGFCNAATGGSFDAAGTARPVSLERTASLGPTSTAGMDLDVNLEEGAPLPQTGSGFGLYVNGHRFIFELRRLPSAGVDWTLRTHPGILRARGSEDPSSYFLNENPGNDFGSGRQPPRPGLVPGLTFRYELAESGLATTFAELGEIHTVPDPYLLSSAYDRGPREKELIFVNLPPRATVRIYSLGGVLVDVVDHDDPTAGGRAPWDLRNRSGQLVASGVYFWHVVTSGGEERVGRFTIISPRLD